ncbi:hypothetical protein BCS58_08075 [Enterovibrio norvegicus]|uniref:hypothetical protein n=1 Tax=Enterovibrio norvegicus TaxID=188144 RepID=UPI00389A8E3F
MIELSNGIKLIHLPDGTLDFQSKANELLGDGATHSELSERATELEAQYLQERSYLEMSEVIEEQVYLHYSQKQQSQDEKWNSRFSAKFRAVGVTDIDTTTVVVGSNVYASLSSLNVEVNAAFDALPTDVQNNDPDYIRYMLEKLIMIAVRTEWAENIIMEGKAAWAENRPPVWHDFPRFI